MPLRSGGGALPLSAPRAAAGGLRGGGGRGAALLYRTCLSRPYTTGRALGLRLALLIVVFYCAVAWILLKKKTAIGNWQLGSIRLISSVLGASEIVRRGLGGWVSIFTVTFEYVPCTSFFRARMDWGNFLGEQQFYLLQSFAHTFLVGGCVLRQFRGTFSVSGCVYVYDEFVLPELCP